MRFLCAIVLLALVGCGGAPLGPTMHVPTGPSRRVTGTLRYELRSATPHGLSIATELRPARFVDVVARDAGDHELARTATAADGTFAIDVPPRARDLVIVAHAHEGVDDASVSPEPNGGRLHELRFKLAGLGAVVALDVHDEDASEERAPRAEPGSTRAFAGALHLLDTLLRGLAAAHAWTGATLPPIYAYWGRGVTHVWSFFEGERPTGSGRFCLELMGGDPPPGSRVTSDTDDHDEAIVLHELGHFVFDRLTGDSSIGGMHPAGSLIDPGVAWEEGRATWFATSVLGAPIYRDTIGMEPAGRLRVDFDLERGLGGGAPIGNGAESSVEAVLWDLTDGTATIPDRDQDGIALGPDALLRAMIAMAHEPGSYPCLATFLRFLVRTGVVAAPAMLHLLATAGERDNLLPLTDVSPWPLDLALPRRISGKIDGLTDPTFGGGPPRPENGFNAVTVYRVQVATAGLLVVRLTILGSGRIADHTDLDLELRTLRADRLAVSNGEAQVESIGWQVEPGAYVIYVRDGGSGNRAGYELEAHVE